jgi:hypothetical protein
MPEPTTRTVSSDDADDHKAHDRVVADATPS